jgi:dTDP-4-amino-4,6-dideoxygalactose transaminase
VELEQQRIPVLDLSTEIDLLWEELNAAMQSVLRSGHFIMGSEVAAFEQEIAQFLGVKHAIACNSGTDALVIALRALGIKQGDEVITTSFSFFATAESISMIGAIPIFVDIDPDTFNLDAALVEQAITPRTKAIIPVHLYGQATDLLPLQALAQRYGLKILEDVAQAFGGKYKGKRLGTIGDASAFSFFPTKNLGAYGDAGLLTTNDDEVADMATMLRAHGSQKKYANEVLGYNSRMDTLQAAILRVKLPHVIEWNEARRSAAQQYHDLLAAVPGVIAPHQAQYAYHVFHQYTIRILNGRRNAVRQYMTEHGVDTMVYYPTPIHKLPVYSYLDYQLPITDKVVQEVLSLPIWAQITPEIQSRVVAVLNEALK